MSRLSPFHGWDAAALESGRAWPPYALLPPLPTHPTPILGLPFFQTAPRSARRGHAAGMANKPMPRHWIELGALRFFRAQMHAPRCAVARAYHGGARERKVRLWISFHFFCRHAPNGRKRPTPQKQHARRRRLRRRVNTPAGLEPEILRLDLQCFAY